MQSGIKLISRIYLKLVLLQVAVGTLLRIVLLFNEQTSDISFTFGQWLKIFLLGAVNDWCALTIGFAVLWLFALSIAPGKYARPLGYILFGILSVAWIYVTFFNTIFDEYGSVVPLIASILFGFWAVSFGLRLFLPQIRPGWSRTWLAVLTGLYTGGIILNAVSEWFFWSEFGVRYNFIAVDYLVYTNEVVGNIMESYPVVPLFAGVLLLTVGCTWLLFRREIRRAGEFGTWQWKAAVSPAYLLLTLGCCLLLQFNTRFQQSANTYANELQATGAYKFYDAFMKNELSYPQFYLTLPQKEAEANVHAIYGSAGDNLRHIPGNPDTLRRNIVLITIESMSASFMQHFGYPDAITPHLDSLYKMGIAFEQCFATGNRTVRGLEAVTLSLPPCPGQSIIKRPRNDNMHSTAAVLREKGYDAYYFYGGNSYFDNMETFFGGNGYRIIDQNDYKPEEVTFANIWGVCDEDAYDKVIRSPGRPDSDSERCETALRRRHVHRLRTGTLLRRGQPPTLVRQHGFRRHGRSLRLECRQNRNPAREIPHSRPDIRSGTHRAPAGGQGGVPNRPDADALLAAGDGLRLPFLRSGRIVRRFPGTGLRRHLSGPGLSRRRRIHRTFTRQPGGTVPDFTHGGRPLQPRAGGGHPLAGAARPGDQPLSDFVGVEYPAVDSRKREPA